MHIKLDCATKRNLKLMTCRKRLRRFSFALSRIIFDIVMFTPNHHFYYYNILYKMIFVFCAIEFYNLLNICFMIELSELRCISILIVLFSTILISLLLQITHKCCLYFEPNTCFTFSGKLLSLPSMRAAKVAADNLRLGSLL